MTRSPDPLEPVAVCAVCGQDLHANPGARLGVAHLGGEEDHDAEPTQPPTHQEEVA